MIVETKEMTTRFELIVPVLRSANKRRLVETENSSACGAVNWKLCK
jgi:hypothetical protein